MSNLPKRVIRRIATSVGVAIHETRGAIAHRTLPTFANRPSGLVIDLPRELGRPERMHFGDDVKIGPNSSLKVNARYPGPWLAHPDGDHVEQTFDPVIEIGSRVTATATLQVTAFASITIEDDVMFAANVFVADGTHATHRGDRPYKYQGIDRISPVRIGRGAWIGQNAVISPGVTIGAFAVIGANSVVSDDVPEGCIAVGTPARVIRRWTEDGWRRVDRPERDGA